MTAETTAEARFWDWFGKNERRFRRVAESPDREALLEELLGRLHAHDRNLYFLTGVADDAVNELIISAEGRPEHFDAVRRLVATAPRVDAWRIIAFKPAQGFDFVATWGDATIDPKTAWFVPLQSKDGKAKGLGIQVACPDYRKESHDDFVNAALQFTDTALGELAAAEELAYVTAGPLPEHPDKAGYIELHELADYIEWKKRKP